MTDAAEIVRDLLRRAGHELRNAQNAAAVNLEVVRSRVASGKASSESLSSFAENAAKGLEESASIAEGLVALCTALTTSLSAGGVTVLERTASGARIELALTDAAADRLVQGVTLLAKRSGVGVERARTGVILTIPPEHETNRA